MTLSQAIVAIIVALIGATGGTLVFAKFLIERQDKLRENTTQKQIDESITEARKEITQEIKEAVQQGIVDCGVIGDKAIRQAEDEFLKKLDEGLKERSQEGKERFDSHAKSFERVNEQIGENNKQISELSSSVGLLVGKMDTIADSVTALNRMAKLSAESQRNSNYDRILVVANKVLKEQRITITDKTNLRQLYESWLEFHGVDDKPDPKIKTLYEECMKLTPVPD